jgi:serine/threonine protein kinase/tetratricopeptide (TPR) repeat protein
MDLRQLGKYEIVGKIGQGAMGEVFKAHDPILGRDVAIKTMTAAIGSDEELRKRFHREAQSAARLSHPNIITIFDFGEDQGKVYMAMELLEGDDLKDLIGRHTPLTLEQKLGLMEQICDGLAFAHAKDVVHRDLKPANLHIQRGGQVKIMDFGLAKMASSDMTRAGMIMGTPNYMSPEQVRGEKATSRSDVFSLGAVFYELLTNRKPFEADSLHAVLFQVMQNEPESLATAAPNVPPALRQVVERAMLKDPAGRYRDGADMREALRPVRAALAQWTAGASLPPLSADATIVGDVVITPPPPTPKPATRPPSPLTQPPAEPTVAHLAHPPAPRVVGTNALDAQPQREEPATVAPTPAGTLSGRASTQVPAASPPAPEPGPATPIPQSAPPPVVSAPPAPVVAPPPLPAPKAAPPAATSQPPAPAPVVPPPSAPPAPEPTRTIAAKGKGKQKEKEKAAPPVVAPPAPAPPPPPPVALAPPPPSVAPRPTPPAPAPVVAPPAAAPAARLTPPSTPRPATLPPRPVEAPRTMPPEPARLSGETTRPQAIAAAGERSKAPIVIGGAVVVIAVAIGVYMMTRPDPDPVTPTPAPPSITLAVTVDPAVAGHVEAAQKALGARDYKTAVDRAGQALQKDPQNAAALKAREQGESSLRQIDSAATEARRALAANDTAAAGRAIEHLAALDPSHPAIEEAKTKLAAFFRTRAEQARGEMAQAQRAATTAKATTQPDFKAAVLIARDAESLFARGDLAPAAQKFQEARDAYERARRAQSQVATATPTPAPTAAATAAPTTTTLTAQVTTTTTLPTAVPQVNEDAAIRRVLVQLERAYETGDTALWQSIRSGATDAETKAVAAKNWKDVNVTVNSIEVQGTKAIVRIGRRDLGLDGKTYPFQQTLVLVKDASGWKISSMGR